MVFTKVSIGFQINWKMPNKDPWQQILSKVSSSHILFLFVFCKYIIGRWKTFVRVFFFFYLYPSDFILFVCFHPGVFRSCKTSLLFIHKHSFIHSFISIFLMSQWSLQVLVLLHFLFVLVRWFFVVISKEKSSPLKEKISSVIVVCAKEYPKHTHVYVNMISINKTSNTSSSFFSFFRIKTKESNSCRFVSSYLTFENYW